MRSDNLLPGQTDASGQQVLVFRKAGDVDDLGQDAFGPFFSARVAGRKRGMGLAHAQRLIQLNGGTIELASQPNRGTTVTIKLPKTGPEN